MQQSQLPTAITTGLLASPGPTIESLLLLNDLLHQMFSYELPNFYYILLIASACWVGILLICGIPILIYRLRRGDLWFVKLVHKQAGMYVIPNAITSFVAFIALLGVGWITTCTLEVTANKTKLDFLKNTVPAMQILCWWPLLTATSCVAWGSFYSIPGALEPKVWPRLFQICFISKPLLVNLFCLFTPIIAGIGMIPLAVLTQLKLQKGLQMYKIIHQEIWNSTELLQGIDHAIQTQELSNELLQSTATTTTNALHFIHLSEQIVENHLNMAKLIRLAFAIWSAFAIVLIVCYSIIGGKLNMLLYKQMKREYDLIDPSHRHKVKMFSRVCRRAKVISRVERGETTFQRFNYDQHRHATSAFPQSPTSSCKMKLGCRGSWESFEDGQMKAQQVEGFHFHYSLPAAKSSGPFRSHTQTQLDEYFTLPIPDLTEDDRFIQGYRYLRRCFFSLMILYASILISLMIFTCTSLLWSSLIIPSIHQGKAALSLLYRKSHLICAWTCIVFGTTAAISIISRIFDPAPCSTVKTTTIRSKAHSSNKSNTCKEPNKLDMSSFAIVASSNTSAVDLAKPPTFVPQTEILAVELAEWNLDKRVDTQLEYTF